MDKKTIIFNIAQNGLSTAVGLLKSEITSLTKKLAKETDEAKRAVLQKQIDSKTDLSNALKAANAGIDAYLNPDE